MNATKYWNWIARQVDADISAGLNPCFRLTDPGLRRCEWLPSFLARNHGSKEQRLGVLLKSRPHFHVVIDSLTDREYESLSCVVCEVAGASHVHLTPPGNEGGIDFVATLRLSGRTHVFGGLYGALRIVGQCKQYQQPVQVDRVDQFIKTVSDVRHRSPRVVDHLPAWFHASTAPIIGWLIAHNGFQVGAKDEGKQHGIVLSDSRDLVEILACAKAFHSADPPAIRTQRMRDRIQHFL